MYFVMPVSKLNKNNMDSKGQFGLTYTEDFRVACTINYLKQEEVLQYFVNRVSFYAFNGGEMEAVAIWATNIIVDCREEANAEITAIKSRKIQRIWIKYIGLLSDLNANIYLSTVEKMKESFNLMEEWEAEMGPHTDYPATLYLDEERFLLLTFDFNLLCSMNGVNPLQVLQYFINQISLARQRALNLIEFVGSNTSMSLFGMMLLSRSMKKNRLPVQQEIHQLYSERLLSLDESLKNEEDIERRLSIYREFYAEWYHTLMKHLS